MNSEFYPFWVKKINNNEVTLVTEKPIDVDSLLRLSASNIILGELRFDDQRLITAIQRKKAYALINDVAAHLGMKRHEAKLMLKANYMDETGEKIFSFADCTVSTAKEFISSTIEFCFFENIPFKEKGMTLTDDMNRYFWLCIKYRKCALCGKKGDIAHYETVGMGRDRKKIDHSKHRFMCLCRNHHTEQHTIGLQTFCEKNHIQGIKLSEENVKEFKI